MVAAQSDVEGRQVPVNVDSWVRSRPRFESVLRRIGTEGRWDNFATVVATRWSAGRVAVVGDAAHGQPPWLGQAANLAFANCLGLAEFVSGVSDIERGLEAWERVCRPVTDHTVGGRTPTVEWSTCGHLSSRICVRWRSRRSSTPRWWNRC